MLLKWRHRCCFFLPVDLCSSHLHARLHCVYYCGVFCLLIILVQVFWDIVDCFFVWFFFILTKKAGNKWPWRWSLGECLPANVLTYRDFVHSHGLNNSNSLLKIDKPIIYKTMRKRSQFLQFQAKNMNSNEKQAT